GNSRIDSDRAACSSRWIRSETRGFPAISQKNHVRAVEVVSFPARTKLITMSLRNLCLCFSPSNSIDELQTMNLASRS
ncbi:unnamed protein product, partial [Linum tenue]